jgi:nucleotide-binding universal stress UspA family protein
LPLAPGVAGRAEFALTDTFTTIVVPLDLELDSDRAVAIAGAIASIASLPIELVTVTGGARQEPEKARLHQSASAHHLERWTGVVLHDKDPSSALAEHLGTLDSPLVVMASAVHGPVGELLSLSTSAELLYKVTCPVLILGPHVEPTWHPNHAQLLSCLGPVGHAAATIPQMMKWSRTFGGEEPWFVEVVDPGTQLPSSSDVSESARVHRFAEMLTQHGIGSNWDVLHDHDPVDALIRFAQKFDRAVFVVASDRWSDAGRVHLHSVSRDLAHRSTQPVLVVPYVESET